MRGLAELVFSTTNRCTARCDDCPIVPSSDPARTIGYDDIVRITDEVRSWGALELVVFTGGEAFLLGKSLVKAVAYMKARGIMTRIVTNAYWATSRERAVSKLAELKEAGLTELNVSCDDYHQAFVPLDNVKRANEVAAEIGLPCLLVHRRKAGGRLTVESLSQYLGVPLHVFKQGERNPSNHVISTGCNIPVRNNQRAEGKAEPSASDDWRGACKSVLKSIVVFPDLSVQICCGIALCDIPELTIGSLDGSDLLDILKRGNRDLIANWLALEGPSSVVDFVRSKDPGIDLPRQYLGRCHACNEVFTNPRARAILARHASERRDALLMMRGVLDWVSEDWARSSPSPEDGQLVKRSPQPMPATAP
jgi:hypothetical protein